jgi:single-strand DNA-binding protein
MSVNKVFLLGRVGKEPDIKELSKGKICSFTLATERKYRKDNQPVTETEWHNIVSFGHSAEFASTYVNKGDTVYVEGYLQTRKWTDKEGEDHYVTEVVVNTVQKVSSRKQEGKSGSYDDRQAKPSYDDSEDAPF